jgi:hypothetical protein
MPRKNPDALTVLSTKSLKFIAAEPASFYSYRSFTLASTDMPGRNR